MKKYLVAAGLIALSAGAVSAQSTGNTNPKGIGAEVRADAHAQHDSATKGIGAEVSTRARAQRTSPSPTPTPTPTPTPSPTPSGAAPGGSTE
ncbi:MAG: hypothetical protein ACTHLU_07795 [Novosphingobium sp.]